MTDLFKLLLGILASRFKARATLEAENLVLRQQVNVLRRRTPKRPHLNNTDRFLFVWLYRWFPSVLEVGACLSPGSAIRRHKFARHTRRTSSSIRSDLDFRYTQEDFLVLLGPDRRRAQCRCGSRDGASYDLSATDALHL